MISTKGRYALRVMIDLAEHNEERYVPLKEIAERQGISKKYLEIIVKDLVKAGLLTGTSGKGGGYQLCRKPAEYNVGEILAVSEGTLALVSCLAEGSAQCERAAQCQTLPMWSELDGIIHDYFYGKKLSELVK